LVLLIDPTGMIIGALQESPSIPAIANGGDAKEASDDSAFAALLIAVVALPQTEPVLPTAEPTEGQAPFAAARPLRSKAQRTRRRRLPPSRRRRSQSLG